MKPIKAAAFTIAAKNYLASVRVLMASIRAAAPDLRRIVVLVDRPDGYFEPAKEDFEVLLSEDLGIPNSRWFHFKYTILELCTAVKPYAAQRIFERFGVERLLYFDPDICVYDDLQAIMAALEKNAIVLTPHLTAPLEDDRRPSELHILRSGAYNLGFIGLRACDTTARLLTWWQSKLYDHCLVDLPKGLFVDQRWVDLVPGLFDGVGILRDPGINVAYWNIGHRPIVRTASGYLAGGHPLSFFHFSGFDPDSPRTFSRHQDRFTLDDLGDGRELVAEYRNRLFDAGYAESKTWPFAFGAFANGVAIPEAGRLVHREAPELLEAVADPFSEEGYQAILKVWNGPLAGADGRPSGVTRFAYRIHQSRADVQTAMHDVLETPISEAPRGRRLAARLSGVFRPAPNPGGDAIDGVPAEPGALDAPAGSDGAKLQLSYLAGAIYESRPDLQRFFPDPCGRDGPRFLVWLLTYGAREYRLSEILLAPFRSQWRTLMVEFHNPIERLWCRSVYAAAASVLRLRDGLVGIAGRTQLGQPFNAIDGRALPRRLSVPEAPGAGPNSE